MNHVLQKMSAINENQILRELQNDATKWIMKTLPNRASGNGVDAVEVRNQMNIEADQWVQDNLKLRLDGKEGTPLPS